MANAIRAFKAPWRNPNRAFNANSDWTSVLLFVPIVVIASKLYAANGGDPAPSVSESPIVRFQREFKAKNLQGDFGIDFVHRDALASFAEDVVGAFGAALVRTVEESIDEVIPPDKWPMAKW